MLVEIGLDYVRSLVRDLEGLCQTHTVDTRVLFRLLEHQMSGSGGACLSLHVLHKSRRRKR